MADGTTRIINLPEATELNLSMNFVEDEADGSGTRRVTYQRLKSAINQDIADNLAPEYSSQNTYNVGDLCVHEGMLYRCTSQIVNSETWTAAHWTETDVSEEINNKDYATPEMFGAVGDGVTDDTDAIQAALDHKGIIIFGAGKSYSVKKIRVKNATTLDLSGATIICTQLPSIFNFETTDVFTGYDGNGDIVIKNGTITGGTISFIHADNVLFERISFLNTLGNHAVEICACRNVTIRNCIFSGIKHDAGVREYINIDQCNYEAFPWLDSGSATYDGTVNKNIRIESNYFDKGPSGYQDAQWAIGCHYIADSTQLHENVSIINNVIDGNMGNCIRFQAFKNSKVAGNFLTATGRPIYVGYGQNNEIVGNYAIAPNTVFINFTAPEKMIYIDGNSTANENGSTYVQRTYVGGDFTGVTFKKLQKCYIGAASSGALETTIPLTLLRKISAFLGTFGTGNANWVSIESYPDRPFQLGEAYSYVTIDSNLAPVRGRFVVDSEDENKVATDHTFRYVYGEV